MSQVTKQSVLVAHLVSNGVDPKVAKEMVKYSESECYNFKPGKFFVDDVEFPVSTYPPERGSDTCQEHCKSFVLVDWKKRQVYCRVGKLRGLFLKRAKEKIAKSIS